MHAGSIKWEIATRSDLPPAFTNWGAPGQDMAADKTPPRRRAAMPAVFSSPDRPLNHLAGAIPLNKSPRFAASTISSLTKRASYKTEEPVPKKSPKRTAAATPTMSTPIKEQMRLEREKVQRLTAQKAQLEKELNASPVASPPALFEMLPDEAAALVDLEAKMQAVTATEEAPAPNTASPRRSPRLALKALADAALSTRSSPSSAANANSRSPSHRRSSSGAGTENVFFTLSSPSDAAKKTVAATAEEQSEAPDEGLLLRESLEVGLARLDSSSDSKEEAQEAQEAQDRLSKAAI